MTPSLFGRESRLKPVLRKCAACREPFVRARPMQRACSPVCAMRLASEKREKADRIEHRAKLAALKPRAKWMKEAQGAFNRYIRERDANLGCISCGVVTGVSSLTGGGFDAGHYLSVGAHPELRFDEDNCHKQCKRCNGHLNGNIVGFRLGLMSRIGPAAIERLEGPHEPKKYDSAALRQIRDHYRARLRAMRKKP